MFELPGEVHMISSHLFNSHCFPFCGDSRISGQLTMAMLHNLRPPRTIFNTSLSIHQLILLLWWWWHYLGLMFSLTHIDSYLYRLLTTNSSVDMKNDWKLMNILIGANDACPLCWEFNRRPTPDEAADEFVSQTLLCVCVRVCARQAVCCPLCYMDWLIRVSFRSLFPVTGQEHRWYNSNGLHEVSAHTREHYVALQCQWCLSAIKEHHILPSLSWRGSFRMSLCLWYDASEQVINTWMMSGLELCTGFFFCTYGYPFCRDYLDTVITLYADRSIKIANQWRAKALPDFNVIYQPFGRGCIRVWCISLLELFVSHNLCCLQWNLLTYPLRSCRTLIASTQVSKRIKQWELLLGTGKTLMKCGFNCSLLYMQPQPPTQQTRTYDSSLITPFAQKKITFDPNDKVVCATDSSRIFTS